MQISISSLVVALCLVSTIANPTRSLSFPTASAATSVYRSTGIVALPGSIDLVLQERMEKLYNAGHTIIRHASRGLELAVVQTEQISVLWRQIDRYLIKLRHEIKLQTDAGVMSQTIEVRALVDLRDFDSRCDEIGFKTRSLRRQAEDTRIQAERFVYAAWQALGRGDKRTALARYNNALASNAKLEVYTSWIGRLVRDIEAIAEELMPARC